MPHDLTEWAMGLHVAQTVYEMAHALWYGKEKDAAAFFVHHAVVTVNWSLAIYVGRMHYFCAWLGMTETSNIFLKVMWIIRISGKGKGSVVEKANGFFLWATFLVFRVISMPLCFAVFFADAQTDPGGAVAGLTNGSLWERVERALLPARGALHPLSHMCLQPARRCHMWGRHCPPMGD